MWWSVCYFHLLSALGYDRLISIMTEWLVLRKGRSFLKVDTEFNSYLILIWRRNDHASQELRHTPLKWVSHRNS